MTLHDLLAKIGALLAAFTAYLVGRRDVMIENKLEDAQNALEVRERVDAAHDAGGMSESELFEYLDKRGRKRPRGLPDI